MSRRPGRPPLDETAPTIHLGLRVTTTTYDELCARAQASRLNLSEFLRRQLAENRSTKIGRPPARR